MMAHQATNIPWNVLASTLEWSVAKDTGNGDLYLRFNPLQGKKIHYFVEAMTRNIREHSSTSRKAYPEQYDPPHPQDIILDDATVRRISFTVHRWRSNNARKDAFKPSTYPSRGVICQHQGDAECQCPIPHKERRAASFCREYRYNQCYRFFEENGKAFFNLELVKTLLLYGEMDIIFRICASDRVGLRRWWNVRQCQCQVRRSAILYIKISPSSSSQSLLREC